MDITAFLQNAAKVFAEAPLATILVVSSALAFGYWVGRHFRTERIAVLEEHVKLKDAQLKKDFSTTPPEQASALIRELQDRVSQLAGRQLTTEQRKTIVKMCSRPGEKVLTVQVTQEGVGNGDRFSADITNLFSEIPGWKACNGWQATGRAGSSRTGVQVAVHDEGDLNIAETLLVAAFKAAGLDFEVVEVPDRSKDVEILIPGI